ncbi:hypothetical protein [Mycoplasma leonicaptivi]|uniref:hypothetical protein n=1 Tax=Mycoplasma leonicaptivi TaxID=36742 RepID=UPI000489E5F7|nr:hypothetical protein [Mycoplasma leonicaptivi]
MGNFANTTTEDNHPIGVISLIGTNSGINKNANIFYSSIVGNGTSFTETINKFKDENGKFKVKLININLGLPTFERNYEFHKSKVKNNKEIIIKPKDVNEYYDLRELWLFYKLSSDDYFYKKWKTTIEQNWQLLDKEARLNDIKIIMSSGNFNNFIDTLIKKIRKNIVVFTK